MILKTSKGTELRKLANGETLTVKTKGKEVIVKSSKCRGVYDDTLHNLFAKSINPTFNQ